MWRILFTTDLDTRLAELDAPEMNGTGELHDTDRKQEMPGEDAYTELEAGRRTSLEIDGIERPRELG